MRGLTLIFGAITMPGFVKYSYTKILETGETEQT